MQDELSKIYPVNTSISELDKDGYLKLNSYQLLLNRVADEHLVYIDLNVEKIMPFGLAWVLVSMSIEVVKPVKGTQTLYATTWHSQHKGPFFRREFEFRNADGEVVFVASSYSVLLDLEKRSIYRQKTLPFELGEPEEKFLLDASPSFKEKCDFEICETRDVKRSFIDCLGHVNNCRYGEFAYDALSDEQADMQKLKRMDIYFASEIRYGDTFNVEKAFTDGKTIIRGFNNVKQDVAFNIVLNFLK